MEHDNAVIDRLRFSDIIEVEIAGKQIALSGDSSLVPALFEQLYQVQTDLFHRIREFGGAVNSDTARARLVETMIISLVTPEEALNYHKAGRLVFTSGEIQMLHEGSSVGDLWWNID